MNYRLNLSYLEKILYKSFKNHLKLLVNQSSPKRTLEVLAESRSSLASVNPHNQLVDKDWSGNVYPFKQVTTVNMCCQVQMSSTKFSIIPAIKQQEREN